MNKQDSYFTSNMIADFLILAIPPLPGILVYMMVEPLLPFLVAILAGLATLLICFPFTYAITNRIRNSVNK